MEIRRGGAKGSVREKIIEIRKNKNGKMKKKEHM